MVRKLIKLENKLSNFFKDAGFLPEIKTKLKQIDFLDVTLNLNTGLHLSYKKPNHTLLYINTYTKTHRTRKFLTQ